jgi:hypothetical protein
MKRRISRRKQLAGRVVVIKASGLIAPNHSLDRRAAHHFDPSAQMLCVKWAFAAADTVAALIKSMQVMIVRPRSSSL